MIETYIGWRHFCRPWWASLTLSISDINGSLHIHHLFQYLKPVVLRYPAIKIFVQWILFPIFSLQPLLSLFLIHVNIVLRIFILVFLASCHPLASIRKSVSILIPIFCLNRYPYQISLRALFSFTIHCPFKFLLISLFVILFTFLNCFWFLIFPSFNLIDLYVDFSLSGHTKRIIIPAYDTTGLSTVL